ncbi:uncharacterized protein SETTUDRAFT_155255 [Exserohilum turcica Et28A]|uniref:Uncharacterized protein n=1 Tax=Exserohilum turcicum (strain 28A) TaxID=671987 RepID=R0IF73_EXST2|nr:uncharacterized protein SETTUDRAFT_155255 [Exserohilum turcica Et28A]EOA83930.1 hypothetical protein SETTUDRAFT_155255 [Exserohilum turcica Et28A]
MACFSTQHRCDSSLPQVTDVAAIKGPHKSPRSLILSRSKYGAFHATLVPPMQSAEKETWDHLTPNTDSAS